MCRSLKTTLRYILNPSSRINEANQTEKVQDDEDRLASPTIRGRGLKLRHLWQSPLLLIGALIITGLLVMVLIGPLFVDFDPYITALAVLPHWDSELGQMVIPPFPPSAGHPFGTDDFGNDLLSLIVYGSRVTLVAAAYITLARVVIGVIVGSIAGWNAEGRADRFIMAVIGGIASVPLLLSGVILLLAMDIRNGVMVFIIGLSINGWTETAQYIRSETMLIRKKPYMEAAVATGLTDLQMIVRHALPNLLPMLLVIIVLEMGAVLLLLAELGFLGIFIGGGSRFALDPTFGGHPNVLVAVPEWGGLVAKGVGSIRSNPHLVIFPALAFVVSIIALNFLGEGLRQLLQRSNVNTSYLLNKRMVLFIGLAIIGSMLIIQRTGPIPSYGRLADKFELEQVNQHIDTMAQNSRDSDPATAAQKNLDYIADKFREYELVRGWRPGVFTTYLYEEGDLKGVLGALPGFDFDLSPELLIVSLQADAAGHLPDGTGNNSVATMLEVIRLFDENQFDPRRSILFIAWNNDPYDAVEVMNFLDYRGNFTPLPVPVNFPEVYQAAILYVDLTGGGEELWLDPDSDEFLLQVMEKSAAQTNTPLLDSDQAPLPDVDVRLSTEIPALSMQLSTEAPGENQEGAGVSGAGKSLAISLMRLANQPRSWVPRQWLFNE